MFYGLASRVDVRKHINIGNKCYIWKNASKVLNKLDSKKLIISNFYHTNATSWF